MLSDKISPFYAYGEDHIAIEAVMRFHAVKRWHMIDTTRQQTLAEHSANVALLSYLIAVTAPGMFFGPAQYIALHALVHDLEEVFTGDIPSHTKRWIGGIKELEDTVLPNVFKVEHDRNSALLVKLCDLADGIRFIRLHGVDVTSRHAKTGLEAQFNARVKDAWDYEWPVEVVDHVRNRTTFYAYEFS